MRRRPFWRVSDFARYMGMSHWQAKSMLVRYNVALGGMLLRTSSGANRLYGFYWAALAKHDPDAFVDDPLEMQQRLDTVEDGLDRVSEAQRIIASQTGQNTRDIAKMRSKGRAA